MTDSWVENEFASIDLGDERLRKRLFTIAERFATSPLSPINHACANWTETKGAYRFFDNDKVDYKEIIKGHSSALNERCKDYSTILAIQDTTYCNYSEHPKTTGLCSLSKNKGPNNDKTISGIVMHSTLAVTTDGLPLGIADQKIYSRPERIDTKDTQRKKAHYRRIPTEEKDSYRWIESLENTCSSLKKSGCRIVTIGDREADIFDFFLRVKQLDTQCLIRANYDRIVEKNATNHKMMHHEKLWALLKRQKCSAKIEIQIPMKKDRAERTALCEVRYSSFTMKVRREYFEGKKIKDPEDLPLYAVYISEINPDSTVEPLEWMLLTNISITSAQEALEKITWYCLRWRIETWHKILKSGLQVEECRLETAERLIRYLAVMSVVAWRIYWITLVARVAPEASVNMILTETEWKLLAVKFSKSKSIRQPTLGQAVMWIAQLGGFLARKNDKQPGITHIWRGLKKLAAMLEGANLIKLVGNS